MADMRRKENKDLLQRVRDRYKIMYEADEENLNTLEQIGGLIESKL